MSGFERRLDALLNRRKTVWLLDCRVLLCLPQCAASKLNTAIAVKLLLLHHCVCFSCAVLSCPLSTLHHLHFPATEHLHEAGNGAAATTATTTATTTTSAATTPFGLQVPGYERQQGKASRILRVCSVCFVCSSNKYTLHIRTWCAGNSKVWICPHNRLGSRWSPTRRPCSVCHRDRLRVCRSSTSTARLDVTYHCAAFWVQIFLRSECEAAGEDGQFQWRVSVEGRFLDGAGGAEPRPVLLSLLTEVRAYLVYTYILSDSVVLPGSMS
jgi:hypothetical protein